MTTPGGLSVRPPWSMVIDPWNRLLVKPASTLALSQLPTVRLPVPPPLTLKAPFCGF